MTSEERISLLAWFLAGALALATSLQPSWAKTLNAIPLCLFRRYWGIRCPGCGMGHAILAAFQGRWHDSIIAHPLGLLVFLLWTAWTLESVARALFPQLLAKERILKIQNDRVYGVALIGLVIARVHG